MDLEELELQLQVWKDLAISKQVLMATATDALGLDPDCSTTELKDALDSAIKKAMRAEVSISEAQEKSRVAVAVMEKKMSANDKALAVAEEARSEALVAKDIAEQQRAEERAEHAAEMKKIKAQLAEKTKAVKDINVALADTPENVIKKMKTLKKQKLDESNSRKRAEGEIQSLRKEKQRLEQKATDTQTVVDLAGDLCEQFRELHTVCLSMHEQLTAKAGESEDLAAVPELPEELLDTIKTAADGEDKK